MGLWNSIKSGDSALIRRSRGRGSSWNGNQLDESRAFVITSEKNRRRVFRNDEYSGNKPAHSFYSQRLALLALTLVTIAAVTSIYKIALAPRNGTATNHLVPPDPPELQPPSWSKLKAFRRGAVCVDAQQCAMIGRSMLEKNGSAVDAAVAAMICNGLINMQSMGLGGGFFMTIYKRESREAVTLDARECAPRAAHPKMYDRLETLASQIGPLAIAVPGELAGYWEAHRRFGKLSWSELFEPSITICEAGYNLTKVQRDALGMNSQAIHTDPTLRSWFIDERTGDFRLPGEIVRPIKLCQTMRVIAESNAREFYEGNMGRVFIEDLRKRGSILTEEDLAMYKAKWSPPISTRLSTRDTLHTIGPPGSGAILSFILHVLDGFDLDAASFATHDATLTTFHRILETFKHAYALRAELADPAFVDTSALIRNLTSRNFADEVRRSISDHKTWDDLRHYGSFAPDINGGHGTAHISILAPNGDAVSVTSSINLYFGSGVVSERTGILTSSSMDDFGLSFRKSYFGLPASPNNGIAPGKRPLSSMSPSILVDSNGDVRMVIGAAGGTKITTAVAYAIARHIWIKETIKEAVDAPRIHHQLLPMEVSYEYGVPKPLIDGLKTLGHATSRYRDRGSVVCAIARVNGTIYANADFRKGGEVYGLD